MAICKGSIDFLDLIKIFFMSVTRILRCNLSKSISILLFLTIVNISAFAQGTQVDFSTIPKSGTVLIYSHLDDDLIWMLPWWKISEKFIGGAMPATPIYRTIISQQQTFMNNNGYHIEYQANWHTPWDDITDWEYSSYYLAANPAFDYLLNDHLETRLYNNYTYLSRHEINKIKAKLEQYFADPSMTRAMTHNNWGEYGHRHHIGLNQAVRELAVKYRKDVWMLGCNNGNFIDVTVPNGITYAFGSFNQPGLYTGVRTIYNNNGLWTWSADYVPSGDHKFIQIVEYGNDKSNILKGDEITYPGSYQLEPGAYIFDGDDDYLTLEGNNNSSFTISMRVRPEQIRQMDISAMSEYPFSWQNDRNLYLNDNGRITARIFDGNSKTVSSTSSIQSGTWTYVAITGNGSSLNLYINGIPEGTVAAGTAITNYSTPEFILGQATMTGSNFHGQISDVRFYNYALSDAEIAAQSGMVFTIVSSAGSGGIIDPSGNIAVAAGSEKTFVITPNLGFHISGVEVDGSAAGTPSTYTFNSVMANHTISAGFAPSTRFTITASAGTGGSISPSGETTVYLGSSHTFTITPATGYRISDVKVDGISAGSVSSYTFTDISASHTIAATFEVTPTYSVTAVSGVGGSVIPSGTTIVNEGTDKTYNIIPNPGYNISGVIADGISVGSVSTYTFSKINSDHTISASFVILTYTLTASAGTNGSISPSGSFSVNHGSVQTYTFSPNPGFKISNVLVDNVSVGTPTDYTFTSISANHTISVSFAPITYTIVAGSETGGSISPHGNVLVAHGTSQTFTVNANTGYYISDVKVDNVSLGPISSYTFSNVTTGHTISATFTAITYTITVTAGQNGSISPSGTITVNHGTDQTFTINPVYGFQVSDVRIDNVSRGILTTYTFHNITENHTISATFTNAEYKIDASSGNGGSIGPSGIISATHGTSTLFTITPEIGFLISDVKVDNVSVGKISSYTFSNIIANHTITAAFETIKYTVASIAGTGGSISPHGNVTVDHGSDQAFTITPDTGYNISDITVDNVSSGPVPSYTFRDVTSNHRIAATFSIRTFTITCNSGKGGSISPAGVTTVSYGSNPTFTIAADIGYNLSDVIIDNVSVGPITSYTFTNVTSNHSISATFTPVTFSMNSLAGTGGSITPTGSITVNYGTSQSYSISPSTGYKIEDVLVDDKSIGQVNGYTFSGITRAHTISVSFSEITYEITAVSTTGGSISPGGKTIVTYGSDLTYSFTPDYGFRVSDIKVNNISKGSISSFSFENLTANQNISVIFSPIATYEINVTAGEGGSITPSGSLNLFEGSDQTFDITPDRDYRILDVIADNHSLGATNTFTFTNIASNHTLSVMFTTSIGINAYPNPFAEVINVNIASPEGYLFDLSVSDLSGIIIYTQNKIPGNEIMTLNLSIPDGVYFIKILREGKKIALVKIVKS